MTIYKHLYLHVPFCGRRCSYCDFSIAVRRVVPAGEYVDAIAAELVARRGEGQFGPLDTIYLGGGTPSKLGVAGLERLANALAPFTAEMPASGQFSIETNPDDLIHAELPASLHDLGMRRVSMGVQSFDPTVLKWMHRAHTAKTVRLAFLNLWAQGITDISLDLIFALPSHLKRNWSLDLKKAIDLKPFHISLYGLTIESRTPLGRWQARGAVEAAPEERYAEEYVEAVETLTAHGYEHYEVSNFALPGYRSRHNSAYWKRVPYLGLGPSAHSFDGVSRRWNERAYVAWRDRAAAGEDPVEGTEALTPDQVIAEEVYLGLRTSDGLEALPQDAELFAQWQRVAWAEMRHGRITLTAEGWLRLDSIAAALTAARSR